jgi:hypothetical protein
MHIPDERNIKTTSEIKYTKNPFTCSVQSSLIGWTKALKNTNIGHNISLSASQVRHISFGSKRTDSFYVLKTISVIVTNEKSGHRRQKMNKRSPTGRHFSFYLPP